MERHSASIRQTARQLLAVPAAAWSRHRSLSERMRLAQQLGLRRPSEYGFAVPGAKLILNDQAGSGLGTKTPDSLADASFDPRRDQQWSRR